MKTTLLHTILGAGGAIGIELAKALKNYPVEIRLVSRNPKKVNDTDELFPANLTDMEAVQKAVEGTAVVYLTAGLEYDIKVWREKWPVIMQNVIDACIRHGAKLVFFDNMYLYGKESLSHMTEEAVIDPPSQKGKVRAGLHHLIFDKIKSGELTALIARAPDFYGPGISTSFLQELVYKNFLKGKSANYFVDVNTVHSIIFTPDAARATAILGNTPDAFNQVWHLPTDPRKFTGKQFIELFAKEMKVKPKYMTLPKWMVGLMGLFIPILKETQEMLYQYEQDYFFDSSKFDRRFDFKTTPYEEGIRQVVATGSQS